MRRVRTTRRRADLLARPPAAATADRGWACLIIDPVEQLQELAGLHDRGLLSDEEYDRQRMKVLDA